MLPQVFAEPGQLGVTSSAKLCPSFSRADCSEVRLAQPANGAATSNNAVGSLINLRLSASWLTPATLADNWSATNFWERQRNVWSSLNSTPQVVGRCKNNRTHEMSRSAGRAASALCAHKRCEAIKPPLEARPRDPQSLV